jgi:phage minor structural protein
MQFHILDENYIPIAVMDNDLPDTIHFQKSKMQRFLTGSADFFDFETSKIHVDSDKFQVGYWIAFKYDARDRLMYINDIQEAEQDKMMSISTLSNNLDLNQENTQPFSADIARPFSWYFDRIMYDTGYEIGINEISNLTRKLSCDSEMSHRAFLQSVATQFDNAELDYEVVLNSDFTIKKRLVHIKKQVGEVRDDIELRYGENIKTVKRSTNIDNLYTAIKPISKDDNGKVTDISGMPDWQKLDDNGNVVLSHKKGSQHILAPQANARFGNRSTGGYVVYDYSYDKVSQSDLFNRSATKLEEISVPSINYEVDGRTGAKIGDTVKIVDDGYTPPLILSARVLEQVGSFDNASVEQATFGNYKALESQISDDIVSKMAALAEQNAPYSTTTLTTNGVQFKNSQGSTVLTARLFKGTKEIVPDSYIWTKDNITLSVAESTLTVDASDIDEKSVVRWSAVINGVTVAFDEVTLTNLAEPILMTIMTSNGNLFKNNLINTVLTATLWRGGKEIDTDGSQFSYIWTKTDADGVADTAWNQAHTYSSKSITITQQDIFRRAQFECAIEPI